jgi:hypothetical protein
MATQYPVKLSITLRPVWHQDPPQIQLGINNNLTKIDLTETATINFDFESDRDCQLSVEFLNKQDFDTVPEHNLDKAVVIESVSFFGINDPKFVWAGVYEPRYPESWANSQRLQGVVLKQQLTSCNYLGWNGKWTLTFEVPVFTWIHKVQNLGWIYN